MHWTERWSPPSQGPSRRDLRKFGLVMATAFSIGAGILLWRDRMWAIYLFAPAAFLLLMGLTRPTWLWSSQKVVMVFAEALGAVVTLVILTLTFFLVITPVGWFKRIFSGDTLGLTFDPERRTYWVDVDPDGPASRPDRPF
jgi:hypothetical protein